jgi:hypothetical protein
MQKHNKVGRPRIPQSQKRTYNLPFPCNEAEALLISNEAKKRNMTIAGFIRQAISNEIKRPKPLPPIA